MGASTILVLDDGRHTLEALTDALEKAGYAPIGVAESDDPAAQFSAMTPELVFLSLHAGSALQVCEQIRATGDGAIVPIIFVGNGHRDVRSPSEALAHGGDYHFGEPLDLNKVLAKVQTYVGTPAGAPMSSIPVMKAKASVSGRGSEWNRGEGGSSGGGDSGGGGSVGGDSVGGDSVGGDSVGGDSVGGDSVGGDSVGGDSVGGSKARAGDLFELPKFEWGKGAQLPGHGPAKTGEPTTDLAAASNDLLAQLEAESRAKAELTEKTEALAPEHEDREITAITDMATLEADEQQRLSNERASSESARLEAARQAAELEAQRLVAEEAAAAEIARIDDERIRAEHAAEAEIARLTEARRLDDVRKAAEAQAQRIVEEQRQAAEAEAEQLFEEQRAVEAQAQRVAAEELRQAALAEADKLLEAERQASRRRAEEEAARAEAERVAAEADAERIIETQRQAAAEARRRADEEAARLEAARKAAEADAERLIAEQRHASAEARRRAEETAEAERKAAEAEGERLIERQRQASAEARRKAEEAAEAERQAAELDAERIIAFQRQAAADARRRADDEAARFEAERKSAEAEAQRLLDEQRHAAAEARRRAEEEVGRIESERHAAEADAQRAVEAQRQAAAEARRRAEEAAARIEEERKAAEAEAQRILETQRQAALEARRRAEEAADAERKAAEAEAQRIIDEQRQAAAEARRRAEAEAARIEEERKAAEAEAQRAVEAQRQAAAEARRRAEEAADAERKAAEADTQRILDEQRKAIAETKRRAEEEAARFDEERKQAQAEAERVAGERRKLAAEAEARRQAEESERAAEDAKRKLQDEARRAEEARKAAEAARLQAIEDEASRKADDVARRKFGGAAATRSSAAGVAEASSSTGAATSLADATGVPPPAPPKPETRVSFGVDEPRPAPTGAFGRPGDGAALSAPTVNRNAIERGPRPPYRAPTPEEGSFGAAADIADLVAELARQQVTGRVDFTSGTRQKSLVLERGHPVDAYSSQVFDRMEEYLLREGRITRQQYNEVRVKGLRGPRRIGAYLTTEGYLKPDELFSAVRGHLEELVYSLFEWEEGAYTYVQESVDDDDRVMLDKDPRALVVEGIRRKYLLPRALQKLGSPSSLLVRTDPEGRVDSEALGLSADERQIARLIDGSRNIEDIVFSSGLGALRVYHVLAALVATGFAEVAVRGIEGVNANGATDIDGIDRQRILDRVEQARQSDYFQILGLARSATTYEVDVAFDRISRELAPGKISPSVRASLRSELDEIERVLEDARDVLRDPRMRDAYAKHLPG